MISRFIRHFCLIFLLFLLFFTSCNSKQQQPAEDAPSTINVISNNQHNILYFLYTNENFPMYLQGLFARVNDKFFVLIDSSEATCFNVLKNEDFNSDGYQDLLIEHVFGCGGNCCGNGYQIIFYDGKQFRKTSVVGFDFNDIEIKKHSNNSVEFIIDDIAKKADTSASVEYIRNHYTVENFEWKLLKTTPIEVEHHD